jgi:hypothetical protein
VIFTLMKTMIRVFAVLCATTATSAASLPLSNAMAKPPGLPLSAIGLADPAIAKKKVENALAAEERAIQDGDTPSPLAARSAPPSGLGASVEHDEKMEDTLAKEIQATGLAENQVESQATVDRDEAEQNRLALDIEGISAKPMFQSASEATVEHDENMLNKVAKELKQDSAKMGAGLKGPGLESQAIIKHDEKEEKKLAAEIEHEPIASSDPLLAAAAKGGTFESEWAAMKMSPELKKDLKQQELLNATPKGEEKLAALRGIETIKHDEKEEMLLAKQLSQGPGKAHFLHGETEATVEYDEKEQVKLAAEIAQGPGKLTADLKGAGIESVAAIKHDEKEENKLAAEHTASAVVGATAQKELNTTKNALAADKAATMKATGKLHELSKEEQALDASQAKAGVEQAALAASLKAKGAQGDAAFTDAEKYSGVAENAAKEAASVTHETPELKAFEEEAGMQPDVAREASLATEISDSANEADGFASLPAFPQFAQFAREEQDGAADRNAKAVETEVKSLETSVTHDEEKAEQAFAAAKAAAGGSGSGNRPNTSSLFGAIDASRATLRGSSEHLSDEDTSSHLGQTLLSLLGAIAFVAVGYKAVGKFMKSRIQGDIGKQRKFRSLEVGTQEDDEEQDGFLQNDDSPSNANARPANRFGLKSPFDNSKAAVVPITRLRKRSAEEDEHV